MELKDVIEKAIKEAFEAGIQYHAIWAAGISSDKIPMGRYRKDSQYRSMLTAEQNQAKQAIPKAILSAVTSVVASEQTRLFGDVPRPDWVRRAMVLVEGDDDSQRIADPPDTSGDV